MAKCTNWMPFDPYKGEIATLPGWQRPQCVFTSGSGGKCRIFELPLHPHFLRPYTSDDVFQVLVGLPTSYLQGLHAIYLMGGTEKQEKMAFSPLYRYGEYWPGTKTIYLFAFPKIRLNFDRKKHLKPDIEQGYTRAGAVVEREGGKSVVRFNPESLREFYLSDVLIHEIGHHVDYNNLWRKSDHQAERFAEGFVREFIAGRCIWEGRRGSDISGEVGHTQRVNLNEG